MGAVERPLKAFPTETLRFVFAIDRAPGLLDTTGLEKSAGNFGRNSWYGPGLFALLSDERVNIALGVSNFLQRQADGALAPVTGDLVGIEGTTGAPADHFTILVFWPFWWR